MSEIKMLSWRRHAELAGETELLLLMSPPLSLPLPAAETFSSKGLIPRDRALGECGVNRPGDGGGGGTGGGSVEGNPRTGLDGLSRCAELGIGNVGEVGGGVVERPGSISGNGASRVTFGTDRERGLGDAGGIAGGDGGSIDVSRKSGRF